MAHESFEDDATAAQLNADFVCVKVDREERPDVDAVYMDATVSLTGQGGWPMTVVLDHDGQPVLRRHLLPGPPADGTAVAAPGADRVDRGLARPARRRTTLRGVGPRAPRPADHARRRRPDRGRPRRGRRAGRAGLRRGTRWLRRGAQVPAVDGPRAPAPTSRRRRARDARRHPRRDGPRRHPRPARRRLRPLQRRRRAGWCRTSRRCSTTTPSWSASTRAGVRRSATASPRWRPTSCSASYAPPRAGSPRHSTPTARARRAASTSGRPTSSPTCSASTTAAGRPSLFAVTGTFEHGTSTLRLPARPRRLGALRRRTRPTARRPRSRASGPPATTRWSPPGTGWRSPDSATPAGCSAARSTSTLRCEAGDLLARLHLVDGRLRRVSRDGRVGTPAGVLEDYGAVAGGFLALCGVTADERWLSSATRLLDTALALFRADDGGFHDTPSDGERLVARPRDPSDNASPSGTSATMHALLAAHALTGDGRWRRRGRGGAGDGVDAGPAGATVRRLVARGRAGAGRRGTRDRGGRPAGSGARRAGATGAVLARGGGGRRRPCPARRTAVGGAGRRRRSSRGVRLPQPGLRRSGDETGRFGPERGAGQLVCSRPRPGGAAKQIEVSGWGIEPGATRRLLRTTRTTHTDHDGRRAHRGRRTRRRRCASGPDQPRRRRPSWLEVVAVAGTTAGPARDRPPLAARRPRRAASTQSERLGRLHVTTRRALSYVDVPDGCRRRRRRGRPPRAAPHPRRRAGRRAQRRRPGARSTSSRRAPATSSSCTPTRRGSPSTCCTSTTSWSSTCGSPTPRSRCCTTRSPSPTSPTCWRRSGRVSPR